MATMQDFLDDLNDRIGDATNAAGVGEVVKMRYINRGVAAMWPRIFRTVADSTLVVAANTYEYAIPSAVGDEGEIFRVELKDQSVSAARFIELDNFDVVPTIASRTLQLPGWLVANSSYTGALIRITAAKPLARMAALATVFDGRQIHEELPVWYALGLALSRGVEPRSDYTRYSTTDGRNGVDINELIGGAAFAFAQFEAMLERMAMPWPASIG